MRAVWGAGERAAQHGRRALAEVVAPYHQVLHGALDVDARRQRGRDALEAALLDQAIRGAFDSDADAELWSEWSLDFLPDASGIYTIEIKVWDKAGNYEVYDAGVELTFTISLSFMDSVYCWPNPVTDGVAHISFKVNVPGSENVTLTLFVYDVSGDLVYEGKMENVQSGVRDFLEWGKAGDKCRNSAGEPVVTGIYLFRLEAELPDGETANKIGKPMIIKK